MRTPRQFPSVNAGSMADIAFLLLIFFLVTAAMPEKGIARKLPKKCPPGQTCSIDLLERNVFRVLINAEGELFVEDEPIEIEELGILLIRFIDNNGDGTCDYCNGSQLIDSSENPRAAVVSLSTNRLTPYADFIAVQDQITKAYYQLRERYVTDYLKKTISELSSEELETVQTAYPLVISEAEVQ